MTKGKNYTPEEEQILLNLFFEIVDKEDLTPDFSKEDWLDLQKRAMQGDRTSGEMYIALLQEKVFPKLDQDILKAVREQEQN